MHLQHVIYIMIAWNLARGHIPVKQPDFKSFPMNVKLMENETVFLPCIVENLGDSFIRWWKGQNLLSDSSIVTMLTPPRIAVASDGLTIDSVEPDDSGEYTCEMVRPKPWSSLKQTHSIQVLYPPKIFLSPSNGYLEAVLGEKVKMGCLAKGMPPPAVFWKTKDLKIPSSEKSKQVLEFTAATHLMSGVYQCEANNGIGDPVHSNVYLRILHKPEVTVEKPWVHSAPGIKTALICRILAEPDSQVEWLFNGSKLKLSPPRVTYQIRGNDHVLQFNSVTASDFGNYTCRAANRLGESEAFMQLSENFKAYARITTLANQRLHGQSIISATSPVMGFPAYRLTQYGCFGPLLCKIGKEQGLECFFCGADANSGSYSDDVPKKARRTDSPRRTVGAANPVVFKNVAGKSGEEFSLIWEVDSISPVFEYKLLFRKTGSNQWASFIIPADSSSSGPLHSESYTFFGLDKFSVYEAKIFARNRFGWSNSSEVVTFGLMKSTYTEAEDSADELPSVFELTNSGARMPVDLGTISVFVLWTFRFYPSIYDIF